MKKANSFITAIVILLFTSGISNAQINLIYTSGGSNPPLSVINLYYAGPKYFNLDLVAGNIKLFNSNFTLYKQLPIPSIPNTNPNTLHVAYLTESLFDSDSSNLEYLIFYSDTLGQAGIKVVDETGNVIFNRDSTSVDGTMGGNSVVVSGWVGVGISPNGSLMPPIAYDNGHFILMTRTFANTQEIYQLPGVIPCFDACSNDRFGLFTGNTTMERVPQGYLSDPIPNPAQNNATINFLLPDRVEKGIITLNEISGKKIKSILVNASQKSISINTNELNTGVYVYTLTCGNSIVGTKKLFVNK